MERIQSFVRDFASPVPPDKDLEHEVIDSQEAIPHASIQKYADFIVEELNQQSSNTDYEGRAKIVIEALREDEILKKFGYDEVAEAGLSSVDKEKREEILNELDLSIKRMRDALGGSVEANQSFAGKKKEKEENVEELKSAIKRIRDALMEELKKKIDGNLYLYVEDYVRKTMSGDKKNLVGTVVDQQTGKEYVYKDKERWNNDHRQYEEAVKRFRDLESHPNIRGFAAYDPDNNKALLPKRNFVTLDKYLEENELSAEKLLEILKYFRDSLSATKFLSDGSIVLQDIASYNIGVETTDKGKKQGLLFDVEGVAEEGSVLEGGRIGPQGTFSYAKRLVDWRPPYKGVQESPMEMVFQVGESLRRVLDMIDIETLEDTLYKRNFILKRFFRKMVNMVKGRNFENLFESLVTLKDKMIARSVDDRAWSETVTRAERLAERRGVGRRIDSVTAFDELNQIIEEFEKCYI